MPVRPPSDIHLVCVEHPEVEFPHGWTEAWNHQLDEHAGDQTTPFNLVGTVQ